MTKVSETDLRAHLKLMYQVAQEVDGLLANTHIGEYESLIFFHEVQKQLKFSKVPKWSVLQDELGKQYLGRGKALYGPSKAL